MSRIKFNFLTHEIEISGSEAFVEEHFDRIQELLAESVGVREKMSSAETAAIRNPESGAETREVQTGGAAKSGESAAPAALAAAKAKRPPVRKYIRKEGTPGQERIVVEVAEKKPTEISVASLKEKFGLSGSKFGGAIRDAEKPGHLGRGTDEPYPWKQD